MHHTNHFWKEKRKRILFKSFYKKKQVLKWISKNENLPFYLQSSANFKIKSFDLNSSISRLNTRCWLTNRSKSTYKKLLLSRLSFRRLALKGNLIGIKKASW